MQFLKTTIMLFAAMAAAGCVAVQVSQDYDSQADFSGYGTWQWRDPVQASTGDIRVDNPLLDRRIRRAVGQHFAGRNIKYAGGQTDFYLVYHLAVERKLYSDSYYSTVGVGSYYHPWYGGIGAETHIYQYDESRLTIDIHTAETGGLLWRGVGVYRFNTFKTPEAAAEAIQKAVDKILWQFPPAGQK